MSSFFMTGECKKEEARLSSQDRCLRLISSSFEGEQPQTVELNTSASPMKHDTLQKLLFSLNFA